jgi:enamine deaminase RidA (YjgF/YER057c/UK114 family)
MEDDLFVAHNPDNVWLVPDTFRSIYSHAVEVGKPSRILFVSGQFGIAPDGHPPTRVNVWPAPSARVLPPIRGKGAR